METVERQKTKAKKPARFDDEDFVLTRQKVTQSTRDDASSSSSSKKAKILRPKTENLERSVSFQVNNENIMFYLWLYNNFFLTTDSQE